MVVSAVLLRKVDLGSGHQWKVVVVAFLLHLLDLEAVHLSLQLLMVTVLLMGLDLGWGHLWGVKVEYTC